MDGMSTSSAEALGQISQHPRAPPNAEAFWNEDELDEESVRE